MDNKKPRSSIRKILNKDEEITESVRPERRISFSGKLSVRLFCKEEKTQNWDQSFEVSDHTSGDSTRNSAGSSVAGSTAGSVPGISSNNIAIADEEKSNVLSSFAKDNFDGSNERNSLHIENSVDFTLLPHEIINAKKQQHLDSAMSITPLNGSENLTFLTDVEREELRTIRKSQQVFDKTVDFMSDLKRATDISHEKGHAEVISMDIDETIQHHKAPQKTIIFNDDDIIIDSVHHVTQQSQYSEGIQKQDKPKVIIRTIQAASTALTRSELEQRRLQRYHQKHQQEQESENIQPAHNQLITQETQDKSSINNSFNNSARSSLSMETTLFSPLIPPDCISGNCNNRKLNLRQLNDDIEHGRIQIFPNFPKSPATDRKTTLKEKNWYLNDDTLNKSEADMEMSYMVQTDLMKSSKKTEVTSYEAKKMSYRYSQADEAYLDKTHFLTKAQIDDDEPQRTTYSPNILDMEETINDNDDDDFLEGFKTDMENQNTKKFPTSRKSLFFENMDIVDPAVKKPPEHIVPTNNKLFKDTSSDTLDLTPELNTLQQSKYRKTFQFTPGRSMIEFEDLEQKCENVSDENVRNNKQNVTSFPPKDNIESNVNESFSSYMRCEEDIPDSDTERCAPVVVQQAMPRRKRQSIYKEVDIELESSISNKHIKTNTQKKLPVLIKNKCFPCESDIVVPMDFEGETHENIRQNKYRKSIYKPVDIDLETTCTGNKDDEERAVLQETLCNRRQTTYNPVPIVSETLTVTTKIPDSNDQSDIVSMKSEGETHHKSYAQTKNRKTIYEAVDIDMDTTCVGGNKDEEQSTVLRRQTSYKSVSIVPESVEKKTDFNSQTDVAMESEVGTQRNDMIRSNKYRKSIYKPVDIDLETSCAANKDETQRAVIQEALCNRRQTTYQSVPIVPETLTIATKNLDFNHQSDIVTMNSEGETHQKSYAQTKNRKSIYEAIDIDVDTTCVGGNKDEEQSSVLRMQTSYKSVSIIPESVEKKTDFNSQTDVVAMESEVGTQRNDDDQMIRNNKYRKSIYKPVDIDLETSCAANKDETQRAVIPEALCNRRQTTYQSVPIVPETLTIATKNLDFNDQSDIVPMNSEGETHQKSYAQTKNRKSIYKAVDIDMETTCVGGNIDEEQSTVLRRQTSYKSISIVPESIEKKTDFNSQTDVVAMESEVGTQRNDDDQMIRNNKYRKSIYKPVDIDLETSCVSNKDEEQRIVLRRQTSYKSVSIVPESVKKNSTDFNSQTDVVAMESEVGTQRNDDDMIRSNKYRKSIYKPVDIDLETTCVSNKDETQRAELQEALCNRRQTTFQSVPIVSETLTFATKNLDFNDQSDVVPMNSDGETHQKSYAQTKNQKSICEAVDIDMDTTCVEEQNPVLRRQTCYKSVSIVPESVGKNTTDFISQTDVVAMESEVGTQRNDDDQMIRNNKYRKSIYKPVDIDLETSCAANKDETQRAVLQEALCNRRQTTYQSVPIDLDRTEIAHKKSKISLSLEVFDEPLDLSVDNHNLVQYDKTNMQRRYRKSIYKPTDIVIEDDDDDIIMSEVKDYPRQTISNSIRREELNSNSTISNKTTTTNILCQTQSAMKESNIINKELSNRHTFVKDEKLEGFTSHKYDFDKMEMDHKELLGSYVCGKVPKTEPHLSSPNKNAQSSTKRLPVHLTPHLPGSKKRHTILTNNKSMKRESLFVVPGDTTQSNLVQKIESLEDKEYVDDSCLDNESIPCANYLTPARKTTHASCISILNSANKSRSILENSVQAPRHIQLKSLDLGNVYDMVKTEEPLNEPQGAKSIFEGNPITISDVSQHFEAQKRLTVVSLPDSSEPSSSNYSIEHNNRYKSRDKGKRKDNLMKYINWSSDTSLFAGGKDSPTIDLLENTRISLVETLINDDDGTNKEEDNFEFGPASETGSNIEDLKGEEEQQDDDNPVDDADNSFTLPELPFWPVKAMERLRKLRAKPTIADVHEHFRRKSMEQTSVTINDSVDEEELKEEYNASDILADIQKKIKMLKLNREQQQQQKKPAVRLRFVKRLAKLLSESCPNWIFDYQLEGRQQYIFSHRKILTLSLIVNFEELDVLGFDIRVKSITYESNRIPNQIWEPFDHVIDFQMKLKMPLILMHHAALLDDCNENKLFKYLCNVDNILMDVRRTCDDFWNLVCMKQAQLLRNSNRTIVRKVIRTVVSKPNEYSRIVSKEFLIEIYNLDKICYKDIFVPKLYFFREDTQYLPTGLNFLREFLTNPMKYLKK